MCDSFGYRFHTLSVGKHQETCQFHVEMYNMCNINIILSKSVFCVVKVCIHFHIPDSIYIYSMFANVYLKQVVTARPRRA